MEKIYYLAYGSNLNLKHMKKLCPDYKIIGTIKLKDYRLVYKGIEDIYSYLTIEKHENSYVPLAIFELSIDDIKELDEYEGYPELYYKEKILLDLNNKKIETIIYIMNSNYDYHIPSQDYIYKCLKGYEEFNFDKRLLNKAFDDTIDNYPDLKLLKKIKENEFK